MDKPEPSYNDLLSENKDLKEKAKNHAYFLECARNSHVSNLQSLLREAGVMQAKIDKLKAENQELKATIEGCKMKNAGESW